MILNEVGTNFRVIGLVEILWKAISGIINRRLLSSVQFHNPLRGFRAWRGMGTATFQSKLLQKLIGMRDTFLHAIFLDLRKAYDALDRNRYLDIMVGL